MTATLLDYLEANPRTGALLILILTLACIVAASGGWRPSDGSGRGGAR